MYRRHLWTQDGVILSHLFGKGNLLNRSRADSALLLLCILGTKSCQKRSDTDSGCTKVVDLVNLQAGINLAAAVQNLINLIRGNCIQSASKGVQLD